MFQISARFLLIYVSVSCFFGGNRCFDQSYKIQNMLATRRRQQKKSGISPAFIRNRDFHLVEARKLCYLPKTFERWIDETSKVGPEKQVISHNSTSRGLLPHLPVYTTIYMFFLKLRLQLVGAHLICFISLCENRKSTTRTTIQTHACLKASSLSTLPITLIKTGSWTCKKIHGTMHKMGPY